MDRIIDWSKIRPAIIQPILLTVMIVKCSYETFELQSDGLHTSVSARIDRSHHFVSTSFSFLYWILSLH